MEGLIKFMAELLGTSFLMFGGCMGCVSWDGNEPRIYGALSFGLVVTIIIQCYGHVSGAHLNPAVTISAVIFRFISIPMAIVYFFGQMLGATLGYFVLMMLTPAKLTNVENGFCTTNINDHITVFQAFALEFIATSVLISICCAVWDPRNRNQQDSVPLKFGAAITILSFIFGPYTGCSMNPVRSFAPSFWTGYYKGHWVYWIAPILSAIVTSILYKLCLLDKPDTDLEAVQPLRSDPKV